MIYARFKDIIPKIKKKNTIKIRTNQSIVSVMTFSKWNRFLLRL